MLQIDASSRISAVITYIPVVGWLYAFLLQRNNAFVRFHARQSFGLFLFLLAIFVGWVVVGWLVGWLPYGFILTTALFALVVVTGVFSVVTWVSGILNAAQGRVTLLPIFGKRANKLPL